MSENTMNSVVTIVIFLLTVFFMSSKATLATLPPCCRNSIGTSTCQRLQTNSPVYFTMMCNTQADFRLIQCCQMCEADPTVVPKYDLVAYPLTQAACFDSHSSSFCDKFVNGTDIWATGSWNCIGSKSALAFRICRLSCGYCSPPGSTALATVTAANYVFAKAMTQCDGLGNNNDG